MKFLLSNDDGYDAPGLAQLADILKPFGDVFVAAPKRPWSGCGHRICTDREISIESVGDQFWCIDAYPADCVRIALSCLVDSVDWVIAGINDGGNLGADIYMSGTVAAAREAFLFGRPSIAISQYRDRKGTQSWSETGTLAAKALASVFEQHQDDGGLWNINLPDLSGHDVSDPDLAHCSPDPHPLPSDYQETPQGVRYVGSYQDRRRLNDSDIAQCFGGKIAISRLETSGQQLQ